MRKIRTYERFHRHMSAWLDREIECLLVLGSAGAGKSHAYLTALGNRPYHRFSGRQSPLHVYLTLCDRPDLPVVFDDIATLVRDDNFRDMLKGLCETGGRVIRWGTTTSQLDGRPRSFRFTSPVLIVMNRMPPPATLMSLPSLTAAMRSNSSPPRRRYSGGCGKSSPTTTP